jgi:hypothetical protein
VKTLAALLTATIVLASQTCQAGDRALGSTIELLDFSLKAENSVGVIPGKQGGTYVVLYGGRDSDSGRLVAKQSRSVFVEDVDGDGFDDLVLLGTRGTVKDVTGDGFDDLIVGAGPGGGPHVVVLSYDPGFQGGVYVAAGDVTGDGTPDIIVGAGPGAAGGHVK